MPTKKQSTSSKQRGGDTSRTSSQGRKLASGGNPDKIGAPEMDEASKAPVKEPKSSTKARRP